MNNPLLKYQTQTFDDLQHRTSHYNRILQAKSLYPSSPKRRESLVKHLDCKFSHKIEQERKTVNRKLVRSLIEIDQRRSQIIDSSTKQKKSLKSNQSVKEGLDKIATQNYSLYKKIIQAEPGIGSKKEWKVRQNSRRKYQQLYKNNRQRYLKIDEQFYDIFVKLRSNRERIASSFKTRKKSKKQQHKRFYTENMEDGGQETFIQVEQ